VERRCNTSPLQRVHAHALGPLGGKRASRRDRRGGFLHLSGVSAHARIVSHMTLSSEDVVGGRTTGVYQVRSARVEGGCRDGENGGGKMEGRRRYERDNIYPPQSWLVLTH
jgi:hypothetical protein